MGLCSLPVVWSEAKLWWDNGDTGDLLQKCLMPARCGSQDCCSQCPRPCSRPLSTRSSAGDFHSQASLAQSLVGSQSLSPGSWCAQGFVVPSKSLFPWRFSVLLPDTQAGKFVVGPGTFTTARGLFWCNCSPVCGSSAQLLHSGANGDLLREYLSHTLFLAHLLQPEPLCPRQVTADPCLPGRHSTFQGRSGSVSCGDE